jgi:hypothetical protein
MVTLMEGGGGGVTPAELAPPLAQPIMYALAARTVARKSKTGNDVRVCSENAIAKFLAPPLERGRIPAEMQAKGQTKKTRSARRSPGALSSIAIRKLLECEDFSST